MLLLYAGLLYLVGVAVVLALKPSIMFSKEGAWKEFGIGRSREKYTWLPFWLFTIMWAMISYLIVITVSSHTGSQETGAKATVLSVPNTEMEPENLSNKAMKPAARIDTMKKGYYILDVNETMRRGVPKYIYLGPEAPNMVYHQTEGD